MTLCDPVMVHILVQTLGSRTVGAARGASAEVLLSSKKNAGTGSLPLRSHCVSPVAPRKLAGGEEGPQGLREVIATEVTSNSYCSSGGK